jgi:hypothetical protein
MNFAGKWMEIKKKYHPEWSKPNIKGHAWYVLIYTWVLAIKSRITMLQSPDPRKLNSKECPR